MRKPASVRHCNLLVEQLSAFLDDDLSPTACTRIRRHARTCARCAAVIEDLQETAGLCRRVGRQPLPAAVRARARARIRGLLGASRPR